MDLELLRTFVEVYCCRHFGKAADRLYITQSAVSARIRQLESVLGCQLLVRERKQVKPTVEGDRFLAHAENLLAQWERAQRDMAASTAGGHPLRLGAVSALWETPVLDWLTGFRANFPAVRMKLESHASAALMPRLLEGLLDLVLLFDLPRTGEVEHRTVGELRLVMATSEPELDFAGALQDGYVAVEWGGSFTAAQAEFLPGGSNAVQTDSLQVALGWLRRHGGAAYVPEELVQRDPGLFAVADAPAFVREIQAAWPARTEVRDLIEQLLSNASTTD